MKSKSTAYLLWLVSIFGWLGFHLFYLDKTAKGILYICTAGLMGIGSFIDLFTLGNQVDVYNNKTEIKELRANTAALTARALANK